MKKIAPRIETLLWRPILAETPLYTQADLQTWVTLADVMDAHEALDLKGAILEREMEDD